MRRSIHVIIIGGGFTALITAVLAGARKLSVLLLRQPDNPAPNAESLRSYTRLHGSLDNPDTLPLDSMFQRDWGQRMLELSGMTAMLQAFSGAPTIYGVRKGEARDFEEHARALAFSARGPRPLDPGAAEARLGPIYNPKYQYYEIEYESLFDGAELMRHLRQQARGMSHLVAPMECLAPVSLVQGDDQLLRVQVGDEEFSAPAIIVSAGPRTGALLEGVGIPHNFETAPTPLLVIPGNHGISAPLFVDRSTGLTIARHEPSTRVPEGCLVIGLEPPPTVPSREAIEALLPPSLRAAAAAAGARWTAGRRTKSREAPRHRPVIRFKGFPQLLAAVPSDPTLSYYTAAELVDELSVLLGHAVPEVEETELETAVLRPWEGSIANHYDAVYHTVNERLLVPA
jgi:glycine/D-amino acid oxidase-like deaminating enzyme